MKTNHIKLGVIVAIASAIVAMAVTMTLHLLL